MALDLTYSIRKILSPSNEWTSDLDTKEFEIRPCDDLDECYIIRTKVGYAYWMNYLTNNNGITIEEVTSPEKDIIEVKIKKNCPVYLYDYDEDSEKFLKDVAEYFTDLFNGHSFFGTAFKMTEHHTIDKADTSYMAHNSEGDEIGWVERESDVYIGTTFTLSGPVVGEEKGYTIFSDDMKAFILRKLEAIFDEKGAYCRETPYKDKAFGEMYHYEFRISNF